MNGPRFRGSRGRAGRGPSVRPAGRSVRWRSAAAMPAALAALLWAAPAPAAAPETWTGPARGPQPPAGPLSYDQAYDLGALWREAQAAGWGGEDAVILLEKHEETWTPDGRRIEYRHRVVRIATDLGTETHADLRVLYDSLASTLEVLSLRTFRDGMWIESGPTAQVDMVPEALDRAPDYAALRERILMHDGVEVPCLLETAWRIEDREPFRSGIWGLEVFRRADPIVRAEFAAFSAAGPGAGAIRAEGRNGAGDGTPAENAPPGLAGTRWRLDRLAPGETAGPDPAAELPSVAWSSSTGWPQLGERVLARFSESGDLTAAQRDTLRARLRGGETGTELARRVAALVAERTRHVVAPELWSERPPRPAAEVYDDAYGTSVDRARLAAAFLREAGLGAEPVFVARSFADGRGPVPTLDRFQPVRLAVIPGPGTSSSPPAVSEPGSAPEILGIYEPASSAFEAGVGPLAGRVVWWPARGSEPARFLAAPPSEPAGHVALSLDLRFDREAKAWVGRGVYAAAGVFAPYGRMEGLEDESRAWLASVVSGVLAGAEITAYNLSVFGPRQVVAGVSLKVPSPEEDARGRVRLEWGGLEGAVASLLPDDVVPRRGEIAHSVFLPGPVSQELRLRLILPEDQTVRLPEAVSLRPAVGAFELTTERDGDAVTLVRTLTLGRTEVAPSAWPELRALLLAESHDRHRVILYQPAGGESP